MANNKRYIDIDEDTRLGYNFIQGKFYVTNKETTTYRSTVKDIQKVLHALDINTFTDEEITLLKSDMEVLTDIYYTWEDTGAYIHTIQFNEFKDHPLTLDALKSKFYIMNSNVIFDLHTDESPKVVRIPRLCSYYKDILGIVIPQETMLALYEYMLSFYYPTCYNQIIKRKNPKEPLYYNNVFLLSNYSDTSKAVYSCTSNPHENYNPEDIGQIISINPDNNYITLLDPIPEETIEKYHIREGSSVIVNGASTLINNVLYTNNGTYTILRMQDNLLQVEGTIPISYTFPFYTCSLLASSYTITEMSRNNNTITTLEPPNNILIGDTIYVTGANIETEYETISCDGSYTVADIREGVIVVSEPIPTNFSGEGAEVSKEIFISEIKGIQDNVISLLKNTEITLNHGYIIVYNNSIKQRYEVIDQDIEAGTITVENIEDYIPDIPTLQYPVPSEEILINVTSVKPEYEDEFPTGEFMVDNFEQVQQYTSTLENLVVPSDTIGTSMRGTVPTEIKIRIVNRIVTLKFQGLYSELYTDTILG